MEAISTGGMVTSWSILPDPSPGLLFDTTNGTLSGVATQVQNKPCTRIQHPTMLVPSRFCQRHSRLVYNMSSDRCTLEQLGMVALEPELVITQPLKSNQTCQKACSWG